MGLLGSLRNLLTTGSRAPTEDGRSERRAVENMDAAAAASMRQNTQDATSPGVGVAYPPNYVKSYDEGRPRK